MNIIDKAISVLAPYECIECGIEGAVLCKNCILHTPYLPSICYICARATRYNSPCSKHKGKYKPRHVYIHSEYKGMTKKLLKEYKFEYKRAAAKDLAFMIDQTLPFLATKPVVTYVPTIGVNVRERGFDHAKLIAIELSKLRDLNYVELLKKTKNVRQIGASRAKRIKQLKGSLVVNNQAFVQNRDILLIDDVVTTGATLEACSSALFKARASSVSAAVIARTPI